MNEVHHNLSRRFCSIKTKEHVNLQKQTGQTQPDFGIYTCIVNEVYINHIYCRQ